MRMATRAYPEVGEMVYFCEFNSSDKTRLVYYAAIVTEKHLDKEPGMLSLWVFHPEEAFNYYDAKYSPFLKDHHWSFKDAKTESAFIVDQEIFNEEEKYFKGFGWKRRLDENNNPYSEDVKIPKQSFDKQKTINYFIKNMKIPNYQDLVRDFESAWKSKIHNPESMAERRDRYFQELGIFLKEKTSAKPIKESDYPIGIEYIYEFYIDTFNKVCKGQIEVVNTVEGLKQRFVRIDTGDAVHLGDHDKFISFTKAAQFYRHLKESTGCGCCGVCVKPPF